MRIELDNLEKGGEFAQTFKPGELALDEPELRLVGTADIHGRVRRKGEEVELVGHLSATVETTCARCLKPVQVPIAAELSERFVVAVSWRSEEQHELQEEDLNLAVFNGESIELDDFVREEILLAMPAQVLCREDCKGLCPICGIDRNVSSCECETRQIDSRWGALKDLRF
jgi:DUF177 domain-containing protein